MKRVGLFALTALLGLCIVSAIPASAAIIYSSGFNTDANSDGIADGWSALSGSEGSTFWLETGNKNEGTASQGCDPVPWKGIMSDPISGMVSGQTYLLTYWVTKLSGSVVEIWGDGKLDSYYRTISSSGSWVYVQDVVVASSNVNPAQLAIDGHAAGAGFLVDGVRIEEVPSDGVIYTDGFNTDSDSDGLADGWTPLQPPGASTFWLETADKIEGASSQGCDPVAYKGIMSPAIGAVVANETYTIKYYIKKLSGNLVEIWGDGMFNAYYKTVGSSGGWVYVQDLIVATNNGNPAQVAVDGWGEGSSFLVDKLKIEEGDTRIGLATLSGEVELQGFGGSDLQVVPVRVVLMPQDVGGTDWTEDCVLGSNPGTYSLSTSAVPGTYDVAFSAGGFLRKIVHDVVLSSGANVLDVQLINGDVDGDNVLSIGDAGITLWNENMEGD